MEDRVGSGGVESGDTFRRSRGEDVRSSGDGVWSGGHPGEEKGVSTVVQWVRRLRRVSAVA